VNGEGWLAPGTTPGDVDARIARPALAPRFGAGWRIGLSVSLLGVLVLLFTVSVLVTVGVGIWGITRPAYWGFAIANYVWWIGIGMGGTFISTALYLLRQPWRNSLSRYAETMTVFAVCVSGIFPILHLGRPWFFYWLFPYPDTMNVWPQWRSSLFWDFCAILAYLLVSVLFWYVSMLPDLATLRDRAAGRVRRVVYGFLALGWQGEARDWQRLEALTRIIAALGVPLVFSVHSMVALDFSEGLLAGWHSTIFPPFFVAGALFSGFAMALVIGVPLRRRFRLEALITERHLDRLAILLLTGGLVVAYCYAAEIFMAYYSMDQYELAVTRFRFTGLYAPVYWAAIICNVLAIQPLWWARVRRSPRWLFWIGLSAVFGMWCERIMLVLTSEYRPFLPAAWGRFIPTVWDWAMLAGSIGLFMTMLLLFMRWFPVVSMHETRLLAHESAQEPLEAEA